MHQQITSNFFLILSRALGGETIRRSDSDIANYEANASGFNRKIAGIVMPATVEEVRVCVAAAIETGVALYPVSSGKNWGMGSRAPVTDHCVVMDLRNLNRIRAVDPVMGTATIEAGVTQEQLSKHLAESDCPYFLDVTGSSAATTIIGNALERGVTYNGLRAEQMMNLEVVLGNGEIYRSGFASPGGDKLNTLYRYGVGPSLDQLFFQSNFGIVTSATIQLMPRCESVVQFSLSLPDASRLGEVFEALRRLRERHFLFCTARAANKDRLYSMMGPLMQAELEKSGGRKSREEIVGVLGKFFKGEWFVGGTISGTAAFVETSRRAVAESLRPFGKLRFITAEKSGKIARIADLLGIKSLAALMTAVRPLQNMAQGIPTHQTIASTFWAAGMTVPVDAAASLDGSKVGLLFAVPLAALKGEEVLRLLKLTDEICGRYGLRPAITLNTATDRVIESVISLHFDRSNPAALSNAQECLKEMNRHYRLQGFPPYRLNIDEMGEVFADQGPLTKLKAAFDPHNIIAPGRYGAKRV